MGSVTSDVSTLALILAAALGLLSGSLCGKSLATVDGEFTRITHRTDIGALDPNLRHVSFVGLSERQCEQLFDTCPKLESIVVDAGTVGLNSQVPSVLGDEFLHHVGELESLSYLAVRNCPRVTNSGLIQLSKSKSLTDLELVFKRYGSRVTEAGIRALGSMKQLRRLKLELAPPLQRETVSKLVHGPELIHVELVRCELGPGALRELTKEEGLRTLVFDLCVLSSAELLPQLPSLDELKLGVGPLTGLEKAEEGVSQPQIARFSIGGASALSVNDVATLCSSEELTELDLAGYQIDADGLATVLNNRQALNRLDLRRTGIDLKTAMSVFAHVDIECVGLSIPGQDLLDSLQTKFDWLSSFKEALLECACTSGPELTALSKIVNLDNISDASIEVSESVHTQCKLKFGKGLQALQIQGVGTRERLLPPFVSVDVSQSGELRSLWIRSSNEDDGWLTVNESTGSGIMELRVVAMPGQLESLASHLKSFNQLQIADIEAVGSSSAEEIHSIVSGLAGSSTLVAVSLNAGKSVSEKNFALLVNMPSLEFLHAVGLKISDDACIKLADTSRIYYLSLVSSDIDTGKLELAAHEGTSPLRVFRHVSCKNLRNLDETALLEKTSLRFVQ